MLVTIDGMKHSLIVTHGVRHYAHSLTWNEIDAHCYTWCEGVK